MVTKEELHASISRSKKQLLYGVKVVSELTPEDFYYSLQEYVDEQGTLWRVFRVDALSDHTDHAECQICSESMTEGFMSMDLAWGSAKGETLCTDCVNVYPLSSVMVTFSPR